MFALRYGRSWVGAIMNANETQKEYWASSSGLKWIEHEHALDQAMAGMLSVILKAADLRPNNRVLDIGCGTGASTLEIAKRVPEGRVVGNDISEPLLARATQRAQDQGILNASFLLADAQTHEFERRCFDQVVSRLGMMFFEDSVAAFRNLRDCLAPGGRMAFLAWGAFAQNPWFSVPKAAAEARLGSVPAGDPRAPGPTAFADQDYVMDLMKQAGLTDPQAETVGVDLTPPGGSHGAARTASRVGPAARIMKALGGNADDEAAIESIVRAGFAQYEVDGTARVPALINVFTCSG